MNQKKLITIDLDLLKDVIAEAGQLVVPASHKLAEIVQNFEEAETKADPRETFEIITVGDLRRAIRFVGDHEMVVTQFIANNEDRTPYMLPLTIQRAHHGQMLVADVSHPGITDITFDRANFKIDLTKNTTHLQGGVAKAEIPDEVLVPIELDKDGLPASMTVTRKALAQVLSAINGPGHWIRELQATRNLPPGLVSEPNPINVLFEDYKKFEDQLPKAVDGTQQEG